MVMIASDLNVPLAPSRQGSLLLSQVVPGTFMLERRDLDTAQPGRFAPVTIVRSRR
jgi:hypothetical protein